MRKMLSCMLGLIIGIGCFSSILIANAEENHFSVKPELPSNQINKQAGYFDMKVKPNQKQTIYIKVKNDDKISRIYDLHTNLATTSNSGHIDYRNADPEIDASLKLNISDIVENETKIVVPARSTKRVPIQLSIPSEKFHGTALGGIYISQRVNKKKSQSNVGFQNQFAYTIALQLREQDKVIVKPTMNLLSVGPQKIEDRNYITAQLQNSRATILNDLKVTSYVTKVGSNKRLLDTTRKDMRMAPNSNFHFALGDGSKTLGTGKYTMHVKADSEQGKYKWNFKKDFTITPAKAQVLTKTALEPDVIETTNWWLIGSLIAVIAALASALFWMIYRNRRAAK